MRVVKENKHIHIELMRIIAIFFIIFAHTNTDGYLLFSVCNWGSAEFWVYLFISIFCRFSVLLYFAISGALMLGREPETFAQVWKKRIARIIIVLLVVTVMFYCVHIIRYSEEFSLTQCLKLFYTGEMKYHLWYLYAYIVFLMCLPFLQILVRGMEEKHYYYMIGVSLLFESVIPSLEYLLFKGQISMNNFLGMPWLLEKVVLYPCVGYFLQNKFVITKKRLFICWVINLLGIFISSYMTYFKGVVTGITLGSESETFHNTFALLNCICMFITVKYFCEKVQLVGCLRKWIYSLGTCCFGIYLFHPLFLEIKLRHQISLFFINSGLNFMLTAFIVCVYVLVACYLLTLILKKIPFIGKYI